MSHKLIHINHPSGKLFDAFCHFTDSHPEATFIQSAALIDLVGLWPEAEWLLLLAVKEEGMKDPGAIQAGNTKTSVSKSTRDTLALLHDTINQSENIAGSLLAVMLHEPPPKNALLKPFGKLHRLLTARTIVYGGPLLAPGTRLQQEITLKLLLKGLYTRVKKQSLFTQFRNSFDLNDMKPLFRELGYSWQDRLNLLVDTTSAEKAWKNMTNNRRRQVQRSLDNGATIINHPTQKQIGHFYDILKNHYRKKVKKPLPAKAFFLALHHLSKPGNSQATNPNDTSDIPVVSFFLVACKEQIIGGSVCVLKHNRSMHEWYACGLDHEYKKQHVYPSVLSTWAAIEFAANNNIHTFDFMGLGRPEVPYGVRNFKKEFGGRLSNPGRFNKINRPLLFTLAEIGYNLSFLFKKSQ